MRFGEAVEARRGEVWSGGRGLVWFGEAVGVRRGRARRGGSR